jgi:predicted nuclease with RNAse H fold
MRQADQVWLGADPGGKGSFGLAILTPDGAAKTWCVDCADAAITIVRAYLSTPPQGVGVDAPLWFSSGPSGDRRSDQWLRKTYKLSGGQVQAANSLRGAALTQGMMFVQRIRELFPSIPVTETHPNAVLKALSLARIFHTQGEDWARIMLKLLV